MNEGTQSVWRVELDGLGPYNYWHFASDPTGSYEELATELLYDHCLTSEDTHPCAPGEFDRSIVADRNNHYGLSTRAQLAAWFKGYGHKLAKLGFRVVEYHVPAGHCEVASSGSGQVAYDARYARPVAELPVMQAFQV